jgi:hypothetical protein
MRKDWFRSPLAILLAVFLICQIPGIPQFLPLVSKASATSLCLSTSPPNGQDSILQTCTSDPDLETLALQDWLTKHDIPLTDLPLIYQYGRSGLRSELRAQLFTYLLAIIEKAAADRTPTEASIYSWFQGLVGTLEQAQYAAAVADRNNWEANKCAWRPDTVVAQTVGLNYDPTPYCGTTGLSALFEIAPPMPSKAYFLAAALKNTYGQAAGNAGTPIQADFDHDFLVAVGSAVGVGAGVAGIAGASLGAYLAAGGAEAVTGVADSILDIGLSSFAAGPVAIVAVGAVIGAAATYEVIMDQKALDLLATLDSDLLYRQQNLPNLVGFADDPTGFFKLSLAFLDQVVPDFPSSAPLPAGTGQMFVVTPQLGSAQASTTFTYLDWNNTHWTAQIYNQWLEHSGVTTASTSVAEFSPSFRFVDWAGNKYTASRKSYNFIVTKANPASTDVVCPANASGVSPQTNLSACSTYVTASVNLKDSNGNKVTIAIAGTPSFTSPATGAMLVGTPSTFSITATGNPLPSITALSTMPSGFSFQGSSALGLGNASISYDGVTAVPSGAYSILLLATSAEGTATQTLMLSISSPVQILGPATLTFMAGAPFTYTVTAAGSPHPSLSCPGSLEGQITFTDNGNGTGTFTGTLTGPLPSGGVYIPPFCSLNASNGITSASQTMRFDSTAAPSATITSATTATFADLTTGGQPTGTNGLPITTSGAQTPVSFTFPCGDRPFWMTVTNNGDGTGVISGNPPAGITSSRFTLQANAAGSQPPAPVCATPNYTIQSQVMPYFAEPLYATQTVGFPYVFQTLGTIPGAVTSLNGALPPSVVFQDDGSGSWSISGTPPVGSGGEYDTDITMTVGSVSQTNTLRLIVLESPTIQSPTTMIFPVGLPISFPVLASGFPRAQLTGIPGLNSNSMQFTVGGTLPPGLSFSDTVALGTGTPIGQGTLSGKSTAASLGAYPITITANNGVPPASTQYVTLLVTLAGDVNNDGQINCTDESIVMAAFGSYRGTAKYDPRADINADGVVNVLDLAIVTSKLPTGTKCP